MPISVGTMNELGIKDAWITVLRLKTDIAVCKMRV